MMSVIIFVRFDCLFRLFSVLHDFDIFSYFFCFLAFFLFDFFQLCHSVCFRVSDCCFIVIPYADHYSDCSLCTGIVCSCFGFSRFVLIFLIFDIFRCFSQLAYFFDLFWTSFKIIVTVFDYYHLDTFPVLILDSVCFGIFHLFSFFLQ